MKNPPGGLPKRMSENRSQNNTENIRKMRILGSNLAPLGRPWGTLGHPWGVPGAPLGRPWGTLGGHNGAKTPPKRPRDPPGPQFYWIFNDF